MQNLIKFQSGRSMIEIISVLAIIGMLSIGGIAGYSKAMEKMNTNKLIEDVAFTLRRINTLYSNQKSFENIDKYVYELNIVQGVHKTEGMQKKLIHALNGEVIVKSIAYNNGCVIVYNGLNQAACSTLTTTDFGINSSGLAYMVVSPTGIIPPRGFPSNLDWGEFRAEDLPLSPAEAVSYCNCDSFYKCGIAWFFKIQ